MDVKKVFNEWIIPIGIAIILAFLVNKFVFFNVRIPTESMYPTIKIGDRALVTRIYNFNKLKRGDIIVFESKELKDENGKNERLIKRLIGLPGDEIVVQNDGKVLINGKEIDEPYVKNNGGKSGTYKVPEGHYFFLGDNRPVSLDARYWKNTYIPKEDIQGKAQFTIFPFSRMGKLK